MLYILIVMVLAVLVSPILALSKSSKNREDAWQTMMLSEINKEMIL